MDRTRDRPAREPVTAVIWAVLVVLLARGLYEVVWTPLVPAADAPIEAFTTGRSIFAASMLVPGADGRVRWFPPLRVWIVLATLGAVVAGLVRPVVTARAPGQRAMVAGVCTALATLLLVFRPSLFGHRHLLDACVFGAGLTALASVVPEPRSVRRWIALGLLAGVGLATWYVAVHVAAGERSGALRYPWGSPEEELPELVQRPLPVAPPGVPLPASFLGPLAVLGAMLVVPGRRATGPEAPDPERSPPAA